MLIAKPLTLGLLSRVAFLHRRHVLVIGATAAFRLDDPTRLIFEPAFWKAAAPALDGAVLDQAMPKPQGEVLLAGMARAPGGRPVQAMDVAFRVGSVGRRLRVFGDRVWRDGAAGRAAGPPTPFLEMPLGPTRAFGGPDFAENPQGRGHGAAAALRLRQPAPLPNVEEPVRPVLDIDDAPAPALAGPVDLTAPSRQKLAGTYGPNWLRDHHPGLPPDADMRIFQSAQPAQWAADFFAGDEEIVHSGFDGGAGPQYSRLPGMRVRAFVRQMSEGVETDREVPLRIDTVWLFPNAGIGCAIHRGLLPVADDEASDVPVVLLGYERMADAPRGAAHYQEQLKLRLDPETRPLYALRDGPLKPVPTAEEAAARAAARARKKQELLAQMRLTAAIGLRDTERQMGLPPGTLPPPPEPELPDFPIITQEDIDALDIDMGEVWEAADRQFAALEAKAAEPPQGMPEGFEHLLAAAEGKPAPAGEPPAELAPAIEAVRGARDPEYLLRDLGDDVPPEQRARAEALIAAALAPPPESPDEAWQKLEDRLTGDISRHPMIRALDELTLPDMEAPELPPDTPPEARAAAAEAMARLRAQPPAAPDLDALLAGLDPGDLPPGAPPVGERIAEAREALAKGMAGLFPGQTDAPPGEALRRLLQPMLDQAGPPPDKAEIEAKLAEARESAAAMARGEGLAEVRRISPEPLAEALPWQAGFAPRLLALIERLRATPQGLAGRDFNAVELPGLALPGAGLAGSFWERARLAGADFSAAGLRDAVFTAADLTGARLARADLRGANFSRSRLHDADLSGADLEGASWFETDAPGVDLSAARLLSPMAIKCRFTRAGFRGGEITDAMFIETDLAEADFSGARLTRCIFMRSDLTRANLRGAVLDTCAFLECPMAGAEFSDSRLTSAAFLLGKMPGARFRRAQGENVTLLEADLTGADFSGVRLAGSTLMGARLAGASLRRAVLRRGAMSKVMLEDADLSGADLFEAQLRGAKLGRANLFGANLYAADLEGADLALADLTSANLRHTVMERPSHVA